MKLIHIIQLIACIILTIAIIILSIPEKTDNAAHIIIWIIFTLLTIILSTIRIIEILACNTAEQIFKRVQTKFDRCDQNFILQEKRKKNKKKCYY